MFALPACHATRGAALPSPLSRKPLKTAKGPLTTLGDSSDSSPSSLPKAALSVQARSRLC